MPYTIVGLGEVLWDLFPDGPQFGGAPANFACHAAMLGADASVISQVGDDELGERAIAALRQHDVATRYVGRTGDHATGTVRVELDDAGRPQFEISEDAAWDHIPWSDDLEGLARRADGVCFGTLAQRGETSRGTIRWFLQATGQDCLRILDVNLRRPFFDDRVVLDSLRLASALRLNDEELPVLASMCDLAAIEKRAKADPTNTDTQTRLAETLYYEATCVLYSGDAAGAAAGYRRCLEIREMLAAEPGAKMPQVELMLARARCGQHARAVAITAKLVATDPKDEQIYVQAACGYALAAGAAGSDAALARRYTDSAVDCLRTAKARGWTDVVTLETDPDLEPIRDDPAVRAVLAAFPRPPGTRP